MTDQKPPNDEDRARQLLDEIEAEVRLYRLLVKLIAEQLARLIGAPNRE